MTFRTRLLLIFTLAVVASVALVETVAAGSIRRRFERLESQRFDALVAQFHNEYDRRGQEIVRAVSSIAASDRVIDIAAQLDYSESVNEATALRATHDLDLLELVASDGAIISSAEWPARFGYKEDWLVAHPDWKTRGAFLKAEELPDGVALSLLAVGQATAGDRIVYVVGGQQLDREFISSLALPAGMRALLYRNLQSGFHAADLITASGPAPDAAALRPLIETVESHKHETIGSIGEGPTAETVRAIPLTGYENNLLGVLLVASSRRELAAMEDFLWKLGIGVAIIGVLVGVALSWWATSHITRPVQALAASAGKVAQGDWGTTVEESGGGEIGQLAHAFNRMTHELVDQRERLVQAERVAAWRELARRLAHELKNPLFPLQITVENMQRARESYPDQFDEVFREGAATILAELATLKQIISRFSDFSKMPAPEMHPIDLNQLVQESGKFFEPQMAQAHIAPRLELDPHLPAVMADPEQMSRVLRNLILNAIDAMPTGGALTLRTAALDHGARLEISDTGKGLTPEECERLFTPYYTTKTHGTGLGLAIVQSVVSDHKGRISVHSAPGKGATFRIDLA